MEPRKRGISNVISVLIALGLFVVLFLWIVRTPRLFQTDVDYSHHSIFRAGEPSDTMPKRGLRLASLASARAQ